MSRVFNQTIDDIVAISGCDWDFVVDMYNHLWETRSDFSMERFALCVVIFDWSARGSRRYKELLEDLCEKSGYEYSKLFDIFTNMVYDPDDDGDWDYFVGVTMEHDW